MSKTKFTKFPKDNGRLTIRDILGPAMKIKTKADAEQYMRALVAHYIKYAVDEKYKIPEGALALARGNLGYYAGYYDPVTRDRVNKLFGAVHPIFGATTPTQKEAFEAGLKLGQAAARKEKNQCKPKD